MGSAEKTKEREVAPQLPTSGQILGTLVKRLGIDDPILRSRTARRYFSGQLKDRVKESSRAEIIGAIADALADIGLGATNPRSNEASDQSPSLAAVLDWHALNWDRMRAFILPRMPRVYPRHLAAVWQAYIRLATIDLSLRIAAHLHLTGASPSTLDFLDWIGVDRRGRYLNEMRRESGMSLMDFAEVIDVSASAMEGWLYQGVRPTRSLARIAKAFAPENEPSELRRILSELRRLYWASDIAAFLEDLIGAEAVAGMVERLRQYTSQLYRVMDGGIAGETKTDDLVELEALGTQSPHSKPLLAALIILESDDEWKEDLLAAGSDWIGRVLSVNMEIDKAEVETLIQETDGKILENWDVSNPKAYDHYRRSLELQSQGRLREAIAEVEKAAELDPLDPVNHFTLGSAKGYMGANTGDKALVEEGITACWVAVTLDPNWILPWTEIGWLLLRMDMASEAVEHLKAVRPECGPLDSRYYDALGMALEQLGRFGEALTAFDTSLELNPDNPQIAAAASATALKTGDNRKHNQYRKIARHVGISEKWDIILELAKEINALSPHTDSTKYLDMDVPSLNAVIARNPDDVNAYLARGCTYFKKGDDSKAISDLDAAIRLDPGNMPAYLLRSIVYSYMERYDRAILDLTEAIRLNPGNEMALYYRGAAYGELDSLDLAIADFDEVIRLKPDHFDAYRGRGDCRRYKSDYDGAIADFDTALQLNSDDSASYRSRGAAYRMKREFDKAIADYDAALRLNPDDQFANRFRGDAYLAKGDYERAIADFNAALNIRGADEAAYRGRGSAYLLSGKLELAIADFNAAIECDPERPDAIYGRGVARELMGDIEGAESDYRRARELGYEE